MAETHRYNSLGQILAAGGEIGLALMVARGADDADIRAVIARRFPDLPADDVLQLLSVAQAGADAGELLMDVDSDSIIPLDQIPIQPGLYGDEAQGRRIRIVADVTSPSTGKTITVYHDLAVEQLIEEVKNEIAENMRQAVIDSPRLVSLMGKQQEQAENLIRFLFAERKY